MNKITYVIVIAFFTILQTSAQNFTKKWDEIYELDTLGKTKTVFEKVTQLHKIALRQKNDIQQVKSFTYLLKLKNTLVENQEINFFNEIQSEINKSSEIGKAFLYQYCAKKLKLYYEDDYNIKYRPKLIDSTTTNILLWDKEKFELEIEANFQKSYANQALLSTLKVVDYPELISQVDTYFIDTNKTLYQFFIENHIKEINETEEDDYFNDNSYSYDANYFSNSETFINTNLSSIKNKRIRKTGELYQILEKTTVEKPSIYTINRIKYFDTVCSNSVEKTLQLEKCKAYFRNPTHSNELQFIQAQNLVNSADKIIGKDYNIKALAVLNKLISDKSNPKIYTDAFNLKETILAKNLTVQMKKEAYPKENIRAFINYKNIDTLVISYYKLNPNEITSFRTDSLVLEYMNQHKAEKSYFKTLTKKEDYFNYSTEIILEPFESGKYLVVVGTPKRNGNYSFSYNILICNSLDYFREAKNGVENFHFRDRKTGVPLKNVIIRTTEKTYSSDEFGRFSINQPVYANESYQPFPITLIHEKDTVYSYVSYNQGNKNSTKDNSRAHVYFDRAIYRPGQKMFYKGILLQDKNYKSSVVPFVTVKVEITNENNETIKTFEVQTNEFGSFSGEFDIPNNGVTGTYEITIDEPDNYEKDTKYYDEKEDEHSFWDNTDFISESFDFKVEEYKRPTFEIKMDKITAEWKLGDTIILKGKATGLAGNTISNATVKAKVNCRIRENNGPSKPVTYSDFISETNTDGTFEIEVSTSGLNIKDSVYNFSFDIDIEVIDINGEARTAKKTVQISDKLFILELTSPYRFLKEEKKEVEISAKTYNKVEKQVTGKLYIYKTASNGNIFDRQFGKPEIETIDSLSFTKLFPYDIYDSNENAKRELVKTLNFDTKTNHKINLDFLEIGDYEIDAIAFDENKNEIKDTERINIVTKLPSKPTDKLFKYFIVTSEKSNKIDVILKSKVDNLFVTCFEYDEKGNVAMEHMVQLENGEGKISIQKPKNRLGLYFFAFYEDHFHTENHMQFYNDEENRLKFEIISMRNKIEPGSTENWQFKILNSKLEAEVLASMYDSSLDDFANLNWELYEKRKSIINFPYYGKSYYNNLFFSYRDIDAKKIDFDFNTTNQLNWFYNEYDEYEMIPKITKPKKLNRLIIGNIQAKDEIPTDIYITNLSNKKNSRPDFYGNFSIEGKLNDILEINIHGQVFKAKVTDTKKLNLKLNVETNPESSVSAAPQSEFLVVTTRYLPLKSKKININNKDIYFETYTVYIDTADAGIEQISYDQTGSDNIEAVQIVGAMSIKRTKELTQSSNPNAIQALTGKISGLNVNYRDGDARIVLRGNRSITGENEVLVIIDGAISSANVLAQLPADVVDNINVIKGAQGAALYGSQGANGVIIVTTKKAMQE